MDCYAGNRHEDVRVFRLSRTDRHGCIRLTLEGELKSESAGAAETACLEALADGFPVTVLVKNVTEIDADGYAFLQRLVATKARVRAIGIYSQYVLKHIQASGPG